eukprot:13748910-Alexandrium_andersonii.AAC.1
MDDKRTAIECYAIREGLVTTDTPCLWVHSLGNPADGLSKDDVKAREALEKLLRLKKWTLVHDPQHLSSRKRKQQGMGVLQPNSPELDGV